MDLHADPKKVELWYFGTGHTTGDIVVYSPHERIAFVGDQVFKGLVFGFLILTTKKGVPSLLLSNECFVFPDLILKWSEKDGF